MKNFLISIALITYWITQAMSQTGNIYSFEQATGNFIKIDLSSNNFSNVGNIIDSAYWNASTFNQKDNQYIISSNGKMFVLNPQNASVLDSFAVNNNLVGFEYSLLVGKIYAFEQGVGNFVEIDLNNHTTAIIGKIPGSTYWNASTFNQSSNQYILSSNGKLFILNPKNAVIIDSFTVNNNLVGFEYSKLAKKVYAFEQGLGNLIEVDLNNKTTNTIGNISGSTYWNASTFNESNNQYVVNSNGKIFVLNSQNASVVNSFSVSNNFVGFELTSSTVGIEDQEALKVISAFPNPFCFETIISSHYNFQNATLTIYNAFGQAVRTINHISGNQAIIRRENLSEGIYFYEFHEGFANIAIGKVVISN